MDFQASGGSDRLGSLNKCDVTQPSKKDEIEDQQESPQVGTESRRPSLSILTSSNIVCDINSSTKDDDPSELKQRCVIIQRDEKGYGLTVSGDNPVFVQSVKEDGAATRAGVQQGDRIIKVNGTLVTQSNHLEVVQLIRSGSYVALTLLGRPPGSAQLRSPAPGGGTSSPITTVPNSLSTQQTNMSSSPSCANATSGGYTVPSSSAGANCQINNNGKPSSPSERVTAPQPVDAETQQEVSNRKIHTIRMMWEQEVTYLDKLRSDFAKNPSDKLRAELNGATKRVKTIQDQLLILTQSGIQQEHANVSLSPRSPPPTRTSAASDKENQHHPPFQHHQSDGNFSSTNTGNNRAGLLLTHQKSAPNPSLRSFDIPSTNREDSVTGQQQNKHARKSSNHLPPVSQSTSSKKYRHQTSHRHHRHTSSPEGLSQFTEKLNSSASNNRDGLSRTQSELVSRKDRALEPHELYENDRFNNPSIRKHSISSGVAVGSSDEIMERVTPPGTPPPPYVVQSCMANVETDNDHPIAADNVDGNNDVDKSEQSERDQPHYNLLLPHTYPDNDEPPPPPPRMSPCAIAANFERRPLPPIPSQQMSNVSSTDSGVPPALPPRPLPGQLCNIMSMEDDDFPSDSEVGQLDDHGPFMSLWKLKRNPAHLAVFLYYLISNSNPASLFFYLISESYRDGKASEMKKWAYEIHSTFLVPSAPLSVSHVDENILHEIDDSLQHNLEKEDDLRNIFDNARKKASEELNELLAEFRYKRTLGLSGIFGPPDLQLEEANQDKSKEIRIIEMNLVPMLQNMWDEIDNLEERNQAIVSALATVLKQFGIKNQIALNIIDRCPTFVAKDKSRIRFLNRNKKVVFVNSHHFMAQHYCFVTYCNHCQLIIWGIGNQGYQCQNCEMNIHKNCVKTVEEVCCGAIRQKKDKKRDRMSGIMENIIGKNRKPNQNIHSSDRNRRNAEDGDSTSLETVIDCGDRLTGPTSGQNRQKDSFADGTDSPSNQLSRKGSGAVGRSESFRQRRENRPSFRKKSDPNIPRSKSDVEVDDKTTVLNSSQSSSNSSLSTSLDSPSNSLEAVHRNTSVGGGGAPMTAARVDEVVTSSNSVNNNNVNANQTTSHNTGPLQGNGIQIQHHVYDDSDLEAEAEAPNWQEGIEWDVVQTMKQKEKNRQDVINELFHTEKTHIRSLKVLESVFYRPMLQEHVASPELIRLLFGNLEEMIKVHGAINSAMKEKKQEQAIVGDIGDLMLNLFDGEAGNNLKRAAATFCQNQSIALDRLRHRQRKEQKLAQFITEAEMNSLCRRLQLKDLIPTGMQRLTKYPLLLENIAKYTTSEEEHQKVLKAVDCTKLTLNYVNQAVKEAENAQRLHELQKKIDRSHFDRLEHPISQEFKSVDLAKYKLVHEGSLTWRLNKQKTLDIHLLVMEEFLILLHKQDDKYILKFHNTNMFSGSKDEKLTHSPVIRISEVLTRNNATDKKGFFLVTVTQHAMYDLVAKSASDRKMWLKYINEACDTFKGKSKAFNKKTELTPTLSERSESTDEPLEVEVEAKIKEPVDQSLKTILPASSGDASDNNEAADIADKDQIVTQQQPDDTPSTPPSGTIGSSSIQANEQNKTNNNNNNTTSCNPLTPPTSNASTPSPARRMQRVEILQIAEGPRLIEPSEVVVTQGAVLQTAEPVLMPIEKLRRKDEQITTALQDKQQIVADILNVPPDEFNNIAEIATEMEGDKEPRELVLAAIVQANKLATILNETLRVTEEDTISAVSSGETVCSASGGSTSATSVVGPSTPRSPKSPRMSRFSKMPAAPTHKLMAVSKTLNQQLTDLLHVIVQRDDEREQFRKELRLSREQIHVLHDTNNRRRRESPSCTDANTHSRPSSFTSIESSISGDLGVEVNAPSDHCSCDNQATDEDDDDEGQERNGANISPLRGVVPEICQAKSVRATDQGSTTDDVGSKEMFVDAHSDLPPPVTILQTTDLDGDHEIEINVDDPDEGMVVDDSEREDIDARNKLSEQQTDNNNISKNSVFGAIFF